MHAGEKGGKGREGSVRKDEEEEDSASDMIERDISPPPLSEGGGGGGKIFPDLQKKYFPGISVRFCESSSLPRDSAEKWQGKKVEN